MALDVTESLYLGVNPSGRILLEALAGGTTRGELVRSLIDRYGLGRPAEEYDTDAFLAELDRCGLLDAGVRSSRGCLSRSSWAAAYRRAGSRRKQSGGQGSPR